MSGQIFITGASGFVGQTLMRAPGAVAVPRTGAAAFVRSQAGQGGGALVHLAWPNLRAASSGAGAAGGDDDQWSAFVETTLALRAACAEAGTHFIGIGSGVEACVHEGSGLGEPYLSYARRKLDLQVRLSNALGPPISWARLHFLFGRGEAPQRLIPSAIRAAMAGAPFACGSRERRRCWLSVEDTAVHLAAFAAAPQAGIVDITGREAISFDDLFALVSQAVGRPVLFDPAQTAAADAQLALVAPSNLASILPVGAGLAANLLERLTEYAQWIARRARGE